MRIVNSLIHGEVVSHESSDPNHMAFYLLHYDEQPIKLDFMDGHTLARRRTNDERRGFRWELVFDGIPRTGREVEDAMDRINEILDLSGVETVEDTKAPLSGFWGKTRILYANAGDMYNATVMYDTKHRKWFIGDVGGWVTKNEGKRPDRYRF